MASIIVGTDCLDAWKKSSALILANDKIQNLIVEIENPREINDDWLTNYDPYDFSHKANNYSNKISNVINTIFPYKLYEKNNFDNRDEFYSRYKKIHTRSKNKRWGTYFLRLINFNKGLDSDGKLIEGKNQLEDVISKLISWRQLYTTSFYFHLSSPDFEAARPMGAPCWQYGELLINGNTIDFLVVYRNHDYFNKTLGNFIGLSKLLSFICESSNKEVGKIICHSAHSYYDCTKTIFREIINS